MFGITKTRVLAAILSFLLPLTTQAIPFDIPDALDKVKDTLTPKPALGPATFESEMKCYNIPYGGLGFASHLLTFYTFWMITLRRKPYWPFRKLSHGKIDIVLAISGLLLSGGAAGFTIYQCQRGWPFLLLGVWKLILSFTLGGYCLQQAIREFRAAKHSYAKVNQFDGNKSKTSATVSEVSRSSSEEEQEWESKNGRWMLLHEIGSIIGLVGTFAIVAREFHIREVQIISIVFGAVVFGFCFIFSAIVCFAHRKFGKTLATFVSFAVIFVGFFSALYSDWILAAVAQNWTGVPQGPSKVLFWTYFTAKRFTFFTS